MNKQEGLSFILLGLILSILPSSAYSANTSMLESGRQNYSLTVVSEALDEKWLGDVKSYIPKINQTTYWLTIEGGFTSRFQWGITTGYTKTDWEHPDNDLEFSGIADTKLSAKYQMLNQYAGKSPVSMALQVSAIVKGTYDRSTPGNPHSPGDKANGVELAIPLSHSFGKVNVFGDIGYRLRFKEVPNDLFYSLGAGVNLGESFYIEGKYQVQDALSGLDIGDTASGFTGYRFHEAEEDRDLIEFSGAWALPGNVTVYAGFADVLTGRNAGDSDIYYLGLSWLK